MKCPVCNIDMIVVEQKKIELDYCTKCRGVWFDSGELELLFEAMKIEGAASQTDFIHLTETRSAEKRLKCPICGKKMNKVLIGDESKVLIDACPQKDGLWFDGGEVDELVKPLGEKSSESVTSFLGQVFQAKPEA